MPRKSFLPLGDLVGHTVTRIQTDGVRLKAVWFGDLCLQLKGGSARLSYPRSKLAVDPPEVEPGPAVGERVAASEVELGWYLGTPNKKRWVVYSITRERGGIGNAMIELREVENHKLGITIALYPREFNARKFFLIRRRFRRN